MVRFLGIALTVSVLTFGFGCGGSDTTNGAGTQSTNKSATKPSSGESKLASRLAAARAISFEDKRDTSLASLAKDAAEAGDGEIVKESLKEIRFLDLRNKTAAECALKLNELGHGAAAVEVANSINFVDKRDQVLEQLAKKK
jgi:hypothetical protein